MKIKIKQLSDSVVSITDSKGTALAAWRGALISFFVDNSRQKSLYLNYDRMFINYGMNKFKTISF
jgi:hypothetical protein